MATPKHQRVIIWIITIVMAIGSLGAYFVTILANNNGAVSQTSDADLQKQLAAYQQQQAEAAKANTPLAGYSATSFDAASVTSLQKEDIVDGTGAVVAAGSTVTVSYFGWTPDGKIFDSTTKNGVNTPAADFPLKPGSLIDGWVNGLPGMKVGGVRKLVIPADQAYKAAGSPPLIGANMPLTFIVRVESIKQ